MAEVERWTVFVCTGCGLATGRHKDCDAKREAVEVVPASALVESNELLRQIREIAAREWAADETNYEWYGDIAGMVEEFLGL